MKRNELKAGATLSYIIMIIQIVISLFYTKILTEKLGQDEFGLYRLMVSVATYLALMNFGFSSAYTRYFYKFRAANDEDSIKGLNGMYFIIYFLLACLVAIAGVLLTWKLEFFLGDKILPDLMLVAKKLMIPVVLNVLVTFIFTVFSSNIIATEKYIYLKVLNLIKIIVSPFVVIPLLLMGYGSFAVVMVSLIINVVVSLINVYFCIKHNHMKFRFKGFDFGLMKELSVFSLYVFINLVIDIINNNIDNYILTRYHGTAMVAVYDIAVTLKTHFMMVSTNISSVFIPKINKLVMSGKDELLTKLFTKIGRIQSMLLWLVFLGIVFLGKDFIVLWVGAAYTNSYYILIILLVSLLVPLTQNTGLAIQRAKNMHKFRSIVCLVLAVANLIITIFIAKPFGGIGAAAATALTQFLGIGVVMNIYYHKKIGLDMKYFWREISKLLPATIIPILAGIYILVFVDISSMLMVLVWAIGYTIIYSASMWLFGMNDYEKQLITNPLGRLKDKLLKQ